MNQAEDIKAWFQKTIKDNVENLACSEDFYLKTLSKDFIFQADGASCNFEEWVNRMQTFKQQMKSLTVIFEHVIYERDEIAAVYYVKGVKQDDTEVVVKIIGLFKIKNKKLTYCDELTYITKGTF